MTKSLFTFSFSFLFLLSLIFGLHALGLYFLNPPWNEHLIIPAYLFNYIIIVITYTLIIFFKEKHEQAVIIIFAISFILKLLVFLLFFKPIYKVDGEIDNIEFLAFFVPYSFGLIYETTYLVRLLNRS